MTATTARARPHAFAAASLLIATLLVFGDVLIAGRGRILSAPDQDLPSIFFHWYRFGFAELARGHVVLWNPYSFAGAPFLGGFQPALLYPPNWLHLILPTSHAINLGIALHFFLSGWGVYLWTSHRGLRPAAGILAGIVFMFCGAHFLQLYSGHLPHLCSLAWTPFIFLAIDHAADDRSATWVLLGMAAVALQILAGNIQYVHYTAMIAAIYAAAALRTSAHPWQAAGAMAAIALGGAALAAIQLLTAVDAVAESLRSGLSYGLAASFPFPPENLLTLAFPGFFGDMIGTPYWGRWALHEASVFVGSAALLLAMCGAIHGTQRVTRFSAGIAALCLLIAFGDSTPLFRILYHHLPGFQSVRAVARVTFLASLFVAMLVAVGFDHLLARPAPRWLALFALTIGTVACAAGGALVADGRGGGQALWLPALRHLTFLSDAYQWFVVERAPESMMACSNAGRSLLTGGSTFVLLGALLLAARHRPRLIYVVGTIAVIELLAGARALRPTFDPAPLLARTAAMRQRMAETGSTEARVMSQVPHFYLPMSAGVHDVWAGADLVLGRYARFIAATQQWPVDAILVANGLRHMSPLLGMLRLRYAVRVAGEDVRLVPTQLPALPRAALMSHWRVLPSGDHVLQALREPDFDPARVVLLESDPGFTAGEAEAVGSVSVTDLSTDALDVTAEVDRPALLLITDNYSNGWTATALPGSSAPSYRVMPADYTLRAVPLPAGRHHIRLAYQPNGFVVGARVTMVSLLVYGAAWAVWLHRRRNLPMAAAEDRPLAGTSSP